LKAEQLGEVQVWWKAFTRFCLGGESLLRTHATNH
jgi:hypothetical protein